MAFWLPSPGAAAGAAAFHENDFFALVREVAGDLCESVQLVDSFASPKTGRASQCYRVTYRSMDRSLTNAEVDALQDELRRRIGSELRLALR